MLQALHRGIISVLQTQFSSLWVRMDWIGKEEKLMTKRRHWRVVLVVTMPPVYLDISITLHNIFMTFSDYNSNTVLILLNALSQGRCILQKGA